MGGSRSLRGGWLATRYEGLTRAIEVVSGTDVELRGVLSDLLWQSPSALGAVVRGSPSLEALAKAFERDQESASLAAILAPEGFSMLFVELTGRCNENCRHCYASSSPEVSSELSLGDIEGVLRDARAIGFETVQFTGGDPLLSKNLLPAIDFARRLGFSTVEVYTNGLAFSADLAARFAVEGVAMAFSVYSHRPEVHDEVTRTVASHSRTMRAIRWAVEAGIEVRVSVILRRENEGDVAAVRRLMRELGVPDERVRVDRERPVGRGRWDEGVDVADLGAFGGHSIDFPRQRGGKLAVTYTGSVVPCIFDRHTALGNLGDGALGELLAKQVRLESPRRGLDLVPSEGEALACLDCQARSRLLSALSWS